MPKPQPDLSNLITGITNATRSVIEEYNRVMMRKGYLMGLSSGFRDIDNFTHGFRKSEVVVLASRPSIGKTSLALGFVEAAILPRSSKMTPPVRTLVFSLEMTAHQVSGRLLSSLARVSLKLLRDGLISKKGDEVNRLLQAASDLAQAPLIICDKNDIDVYGIREIARLEHAKEPLGIIVIDYVQLIRPSDDMAPQPREQQMAEISRELKAMAKELDIPVVILSQLNRSSEKESRSPRLGDLRDSGALEQDADVVMIMTRPKEADDRFQVADDAVDLIVAKQRNGPVGELKLTFLRDITRFEHYTP